jgi:hypothetical protein
MGLDKSAYSRILDNVGSIVPCPFLGTELMEEPVTHGLPVINANHYAKKNSH